MAEARPSLRAIFDEVSELAPGEQRRAFLDQACGDDAALRANIEELLQSQDTAGGFLADPKREASASARVPEGKGDRIGRYKLLQKIGEGGCGVVYLAEQTEPVRRRVALKVIKLGMDTRLVIARFEAERQALAMMDHASIARVFDAGATDSGRPYFVMELVDGIEITKYCDQNQLSTAARLQLFIQVCHAIQHAHQKGIIHRDLKPSNILVTTHDRAPLPKVIDFGIAKATEGRLTDGTAYTQLHQLIGTPAYMSPEQAEVRGLDVDTRADIYSLGVLLYELLTGSTPFDTKEMMASGLDAMRKTIREKQPIRPSTRLRHQLAAKAGAEAIPSIGKGRQSAIESDLDWIVMKCLEKDRIRRYETANGLAADLKRHLNNEPVVARPPSTAYKLQKSWRRNKLVFTAALVVLAALVVGIGVSRWQAIEASKARNNEKQERLVAQAAQKEAERSQAAEKLQRQRAEQGEADARRLVYGASMNMAQQCWEQNNISFLRKWLDETKESPSRGFEWYYWQRQMHLAAKTLRGHFDHVSSVAFSPDGQRIVTGSYDNTAKVWETASGKELLTLHGHSAEIDTVAYSPDGQRIIIGSWGGTAEVWEAATGKELLTLKAHRSAINGVAYSPDGQLIITGGADHTATVWAATNGNELLTLRGHDSIVNAVAFSPDGQWIVTGSYDRTAKVWQTTSGKEWLTLKGHSEQIKSVAFSPDGQRIVTGSEDQTAKVWEAASGKELLTIKGNSGLIFSVAYSPDGQRIVTGSEDQTAKVWDAASGKELLTIKGHSDALRSVAFSPDGQRIVTGSDDYTAKIWEAPTGSKELLLIPKGHNDKVNWVAFSPDGQRMVTGSDDQTAKVWEVASGKELLTIKGHSARVSSVAFSPDGRRMVTGSGDRLAKVWEAASGKELLTLKGHSSEVSSVAFSSDGQRIVTGSSDNTAKVWEAANGRELLTLKGHSDQVWSVAFSPNGQRIATGSGDQTARVWEAASGKELLVLKGHSDLVSSVAFSPDGQRIATGSYDKTVKVWEAASGKELLTVKGHRVAVWSVAFSPDGHRIVTGSDDQTAKVWDAVSGKELLTLKGHGAEVRSVAFSPDSQRIATCSYDKTVKVWDAANPKQVAAWQEEERAAEQHLAVWQRERTAEKERQAVVRARNSIKQWLILAPFPLASGQNGPVGLDIEQIEGEAQLKPGAGGSKPIGGSELKWREVALTNEVIDFNAIMGQMTEHSVAYAVCCLRSQAEQRGLQILVGNDDEAKVYLNGKEVYKDPTRRGFEADQGTVPDITLSAGLNVLVFKVVNETGRWLGSIRFTDAQGNPVKGITVTLDTAGKNQP